MERFLLVQPRFMGDVLLCTPSVRALRRAYPTARIDFVTEPPGADALRGNPHLDSVIEWPRGRNALSLGWSLRGRYDTVVDFRSTPSTTQLAWLTGARRRIGVSSRGPWRHLYTDVLARSGDDVYMARQKLALLAPLGIDPAAADVSLEISIGPEERQRAADVWARAGLPIDAPVVAVSPVARVDYKQWGLDRWAAVVAELRRAGLPVLVTSGPGERAQAEAVAAGSGAVWDCEPATVRGLAALYARCALWLGNDGGPKHVAVAAGVPTFTVARWTAGAVWTDTSGGSPHRFVERPPPGGCDLECGRCAHRACLAEVRPEDVVSAALPLLRRPAAVGAESCGR